MVVFPAKSRTSDLCFSCQSRPALQDHVDFSLGGSGFICWDMLGPFGTIKLLDAWFGLTAKYRQIPAGDSPPQYPQELNQSSHTYLD